MTTSMEWTVVLTGPARKALKRLPSADRTRIVAALDEMQQNPFQGDIRKLQGLSGFRRRVGNWRIFFEVVPERKHVAIAAIERRTSTTY
jgi:mRNA interferase RelE/StbE